MRDTLAGVIAIVLLVVAASLASALRQYRRRRQRARDSERALGRAIVAEIPTKDDLVLFSEDDRRFYYGERSIDKDLIVAVRMLINGAPIAAYVSRRTDRRTAARLQRSQRLDDVLAGDDVLAEPECPATVSGVGEREVEGIGRDRWDVEIDTVKGTVVVACGAIRERVSQELTRAVFAAVKRELERRDAA